MVSALEVLLFMKVGEMCFNHRRTGTKTFILSI